MNENKTKIKMCSLCLPHEVWTFVFRLLPLSDRLRVRASCKYFRHLVDNALWRDWTLELRTRSVGDDEYDEEGFWSMVRCWRVTSARVTSPNSLRLTRVVKELPGVTTLVKNIGVMTIQDLKHFTSLKRLDLTSSSDLCLKDFTLFLPQCLTHLRVCQFSYNTPELPLELPFTKLKSLVFHSAFDSHPVTVLHFFLSSLPQLQHLSLRIYTDNFFEGNVSDLTPLHNCPLSSLELLDCYTNKLPLELMKMLSTLPFLRSLAIVCLCTGDVDVDDDTSHKLSTWLRDLPALTSLLVTCLDIGGFVRSIPCSVTRLILVPLEVNPWTEIMSALSTQLPNLHHLHLQPHDALGSDTALIPRFFPKLKTLRLSHKKVPEDAFLSLASLKELEVLETLDEEPLPAALISKLRELTKNRVQICSSSENVAVLTCWCK
uniref:F-box domain-containing protein n=1 Tax=Neogobius melanostomus TaxID=47308 RepID=A0A8C6UWT2_9GOBI